MDSNMRAGKRNKGFATKIALSLMVVGILGVGAGVTTAGYIDKVTTSIPVSAGSINLTANGSKAATISLPVSRINPGETHSVTVTLNNSGNMPLTYGISSTNSKGVTGLASRLEGYMVGASPINNTTQKLNAMSTINPQSLAAGASQVVTLEVEWPNGTPEEDNPFQGKNDNVIITFTAESVAP
jgi:hypothetical protein